MPTYKYVVDNLKQLEVNGYNIFGDIFHLDKKAGRLVIKSYPGTADHLLNHQELISKCFEGYEKAEKEHGPCTPLGKPLPPNFLIGTVKV